MKTTKGANSAVRKVFSACVNKRSRSDGTTNRWFVLTVKKIVNSHLGITYIKQTIFPPAVRRQVSPSAHPGGSFELCRALFRSKRSRACHIPSKGCS